MNGPRISYRWAAAGQTGMRIREIMSAFGRTFTDYTICSAGAPPYPSGFHRNNIDPSAINYSCTYCTNRRGILLLSGITLIQKRIFRVAKANNGSAWGALAAKKPDSVIPAQAGIQEKARQTYVDKEIVDCNDLMTLCGGEDEP